MNEKTNVFKKMTSFREFGVLVALLALVVIFAFSSPIFLSGENMLNITRQVSVVSLLAIGMTLVIVTGGIDLSVSAVIAAGGIITASAMRDMNLSIPVERRNYNRNRQWRANCSAKYACLYYHDGHHDHHTRPGLHLYRRISGLRLACSL